MSIFAKEKTIFINPKLQKQKGVRGKFDMTKKIRGDYNIPMTKQQYKNLAGASDAWHWETTETSFTTPKNVSSSKFSIDDLFEPKSKITHDPDEEVIIDRSTPSQQQEAPTRFEKDWMMHPHVGRPKYSRSQSITPAATSVESFNEEIITDLIGGATPEYTQQSTKPPAKPKKNVSFTMPSFGRRKKQSGLGTKIDLNEPMPLKDRDISDKMAKVRYTEWESVNFGGP